VASSLARHLAGLGVEVVSDIQNCGMADGPNSLIIWFTFTANI
jgi:hypothetical protein